MKSNIEKQKNTDKFLSMIYDIIESCNITDCEKDIIGSAFYNLGYYIKAVRDNNKKDKKLFFDNLERDFMDWDSIN